LRINRREAKALAEHLGRAVHAANAQFHLLNAFAILAQESGNRAVSLAIASGQYIEAHRIADPNLEFFSVKVRRHIGETRRPICSAYLRKSARLYRDADGCSRESRTSSLSAEYKAIRDLGIGKPTADALCCAGKSDRENLSCRLFTRSFSVRAESIDQPSEARFSGGI